MFVGLCFSNPQQELEHIVREKSKDVQMHVVACGIPAQLKEFSSVLVDCLELGHWVFLQNVHLDQCLNPDIIQLIEV